MSVDRARVDERAAYIREQTRALQQLIEGSPREEILRNPWTLRGIRYALQTAFEAMIDISFHICAKDLNYGPSDGRHALRKLSEAGIINSEDLATFESMVGFRNRIVHGYLQVTDERVYEIAANEREDLNKFLAQVYAYLDRRSGNR